MPSRIRDLLLLFLICFVVFWWRLGALGLIDPDEPFYAQTAREMVQSGDWVTPQIFGQPQYEKPIFFYWLTAASFKVFGESEFSARVASALPGTLAVLLVYAFASAVWTRRVGLLSSIVLATGLEYALMSRLMLTDIALALFIAGSLFSYWMALQNPQRRDRWMMLHFVCGGLGVLTKGPIATLVTLFAAFSFRLMTRRPMAYRGRGLWIGLGVYGLIAAPWYILMLMRHGWEFFDAFFIHENLGRLVFAEHPSNNYPFYYPIILLIGSVPWLPLVVLTAWRGLASAAAFASQKWVWLGVLAGFVVTTFVQKHWSNVVAYMPGPSGGERSPVLVALIVILVALSQFAMLWAAWRGTRGRNFDERSVFLWGWLLTSLVFLNIAQSKLPSYIFYVFVPLAMLVALYLDEVLTRGFSTARERTTAIVLGGVELLATVAVPFIPIAQPFTVPALLAGSCFAIALFLLAMRHYRTWIAVNSMAVAALVIGALIVALPGVEAYSSSKPVAKAMMKDQRPGEPFLAGKFLARGIYYYTHEPVSVISIGSKPFWSDHPLPIVAGNKGVRKYLDEHNSSMVTIRRSEWLGYWSRYPFTPAGVEPQWFGENGVIRMEKPVEDGRDTKKKP